MEIDDYDCDENMKICIVSSCGGHLTEVRLLKPIYEKFDHFYVLNEKIDLPGDMVGKTHFIRHSERDWLFIMNLWEAYMIFRKERPNLVISTGAGPAVPFCIIGKVFRIRSIFIETSAQVMTPSLTGRILYYMADEFYYQWENLRNYYPKGIFGGLLY
jgi:UDP-N-acetylglucosamine:LPS N-acetylglucosamine transferase